MPEAPDGGVEMCVAAQQPADRCGHGLVGRLELRFRKLVHRWERQRALPEQLVRQSSCCLSHCNKWAAMRQKVAWVIRKALGLGLDVGWPCDGR
eukprot:365228-Chlamydomonas_euryale.AAC.7